jgi:hypothetical protein
MELTDKLRWSGSGIARLDLPRDQQLSVYRSNDRSRFNVYLDDLTMDRATIIATSSWMLVDELTLECILQELWGPVLDETTG